MRTEGTVSKRCYRRTVGRQRVEKDRQLTVFCCWRSCQREKLGDLWSPIRPFKKIRLSKFQRIVSNRHLLLCAESMANGFTQMLQVARMAETDLHSACSSDSTAVVRLELRQAGAGPFTYTISPGGFLIGSVVGCDLRLPGRDLPPVICLISWADGEVRLRQLTSSYPVLLNGRPTKEARLADGDRIAFGDCQGQVFVPPLPVGGFVTERLSLRERELNQQLEDVSRQRQALEEQAARLQKQQEEVEAFRQELADLRQELFERYRERRDRLAGFQEAINRAALKLQERKRLFDEEEKRRKQVDATKAEDSAEKVDPITRLDARLEELEKRERRVAEQLELLEISREECRARECQIAEERQTLEEQQAEYRADLVRLDRARGELEKREQQLQLRLGEVERREQDLEAQKRDVEEQEKQLHEWHGRLCAQADELAQREQELRQARARCEEQERQLADRLHAFEGQQAAVAQLHNRLQQAQQDLQREEQELADQRRRQDEAEAELRAKIDECRELRRELELQKSQLEEERKELERRAEEIARIVANQRQTEEKLAAEEQRLQRRAQELDAIAARQSEEASLQEIRSAQLVEMQQRLASERQALREREAALAHSEQARAALQEQLRRRSEDLAERQKQLSEQARKQAEELEAFERQRAAIAEEQKLAEQRLSELQRQIETKTKEVEALQEGLARREEEVCRHVERLKEAGQKIARARKFLAQERYQWESERREQEDRLAQARSELEALRHEVLELQETLPELELTTQTAADKLAAARERLSEHLEELHAYARQRQEDLENLRGQVQEEASRLQQQAATLLKARDEYRLAVAGFRQQVIAWQGQVSDLKRSLAADESRIAATTARLAEKEQELEVQQREVAEKRSEVDRHLNDMREWYRQKLRELAREYEPEVGSATEPQANSAILPMTEIEPGDKRLGELLQSHGLIDERSLTALLVEASRQRRSLRQVLLASGHVTLYQLALIEAGNLDGLMLGPVRVVDRLRVTSKETVYRVFDPRRPADKGHVLLRHLAEAEAADANRAEEFRRCFSLAASVQHPHVAATYEVLEITGRPAVLQEWLTGLPATEWADRASAPGVCYRLLTQAALGLQALHQSGQRYGRLHPAALHLNGDGILKLSCFGDPTWLLPDELRGAEQSTADELRALGILAREWLNSASRSRPRTKAPSALVELIEKLADEENGISSASDLLDALDNISALVPANADAWERLLEFICDHSDKTQLRQTA
ncbi:MAG: hypothetical protein KatS3mg105_4467 [Gemmatales bacterium]|nr:MAG: hypothetical protein KatS3mg105_4467 [Gemmatales bacterium]